MTTETLTAAWIFSGKVYGPGEADLPEDAHKALGEKGAFTPEVVAAEAENPAGVPQDTAPVVDPNPVDEALIEALGADLAYALRDAGFDSLDAIQAASDADLLAINGIGKARLEALRALKSGE